MVGGIGKSALALENTRAMTEVIYSENIFTAKCLHSWKIGNYPLSHSKCIQPTNLDSEVHLGAVNWCTHFNAIG